MAKLNFRQVTAANETDIPGIARVINAVQGNIESNIKLLQNIPFLEGNLLTLAVQSGTNIVDHKLGRVPQGYLILARDSNVSLYDNIRTGATSTTVELYASSSANIKIWVF